MLQSKIRQIQGYQNDLVRILDKKSDLNKKLADKRYKLSDATLKLQKEEQMEAKKSEKANKDILRSYEQRIDNLTNQLIQENNNQLKNRSQSLYSDSNSEQYDVFISHASEDKESFVDEFCELLQKLGIKVWYDSISIKWGDSLRAKIDDGLRNSKFGVVVISPAYISKGWTQYELDGLFQQEMTGGKTVLPL
ncbi:MAG: toll/interleukin-1 receptor domain-containing protein [Bacillota bacterium]|nr:toll/interleukin-1 receptor domain-containing protein [Bacillota bacterium]